MIEQPNPLRESAVLSFASRFIPAGNARTFFLMLNGLLEPDHLVHRRGRYAQYDIYVYHTDDPNVFEIRANHAKAEWASGFAVSTPHSVKFEFNPQIPVTILEL